jgi:hypothetical protein
MFMATCIRQAASNSASAKGNVSALATRYEVRPGKTGTLRQDPRRGDEVLGDVHPDDLAAVTLGQEAGDTADAAADVEHAHSGLELESCREGDGGVAAPVWNSSTAARSPVVR